MLAQKDPLHLWTTIITPMVICVAMQWIYEGRIEHQEVWPIIRAHEWFVGIQSVLMVYISFVPFYSDKFPIWTKIGPIIHMIAIHTIFILIPVISIIHTSINVEHVRVSRAVGWLFTFVFINVMCIIYYFYVPLKVVRGASQFLKNRREKVSQEIKEDEEKATADYFNIWRGHGEGPIRIGKQIDIGQNLYSLLFMSCVRKEYIRAVEGKFPNAAVNTAINADKENDGSEESKKKNDEVSNDDVCEGGEEEDNDDFGPWKEVSNTTMRIDSRSHNLKMVILIQVFQIIIVYYLIMLLKPDFVDKSINLLEPEIGISRFMTGILLHYAMTDYIRLGMEMMKFAMNHPWKFQDPHTAFLCGFMKVLINFIVEMFNYNLLMTSDSVL